MIGETITGTLKYVTGYTGFNVQDQNGNYLALHKKNNSGDGWHIIRTYVDFGVRTSWIDDDHLVCWITNNDAYLCAEVEFDGGEIRTITYSFSGLTLEPPEV